MEDNVPRCGVVGCLKPQKSHKHVGPVVRDERVVVWPVLPTAPAWCYSGPTGTVIENVGGRVIVRLDSGEIKDVDVANVKRKRTWRAPDHKPSTPRMRPHKPLDDGEWEEVPLPFGEREAS